MSSDKYCCVPGCKESGDTHETLHGFPNPEKDRDRFNTWLYAIGGDILGLENERIYKYRRVCRKHFEEQYLCRNNRISNIAVPRLNIPGPLSLTWVKNTLSERKPMQPQNQIVIKQSMSVDTELCPFGKLITHQSSLHENEESYKENTDVSTVTVASLATVARPAAFADPIGIASSVTTNNSRKENLGKRLAVKKSTRRLFLTPAEEELHHRIIAAKVKISKIKNKSKRLSAELKTAKKIASNPALLGTLENCTSSAKLLMRIQWRENKKKGKGRRFTIEEKIIALSILKQSPKAYRFIRKIFILPAPQTLFQLIQHCNLRPGLNKNIFSQLKKKSETMKVEEKLCVLLFDEVSLKANITYHERKDKITGFIDNGQQRQPEFADHAQVFMIRGLIKNYKQAVSYTFSSSATKGPELARQIRQVVTEVQQAGLIVVATVCDQGTNNRQAIKLLLNETRGIYLRKGEEPKNNIILINDNEIVPLYDPPHLLKGLRNNLLTKNLSYEQEGVTKIAKWSHLQQLYEENPGYKGVRMIPKLTENHINPQKLNKMKVKYASQVFSRTLASNMGYLAEKDILPQECKDTADLLYFMDNIFDSVNGSFIKNRHAKPLLGPASPNSVHKSTWAEGKKVFRSMKFIVANGKKESVPSIINWIWTLEGIEVLLKKLKDDFQVTSVWLRHLNQDPLENFFGSIRSHGYRNTNPTCDQFESAFCTLLINSLNSVQIRGKNCEGDFCDTLHALVVDDNPEPSSTCTMDLDNILNFEFTPIEEKEKDPRIIAPLQYMSGYFVKKIKKRIISNCTECTNNLTSNDAIEYINSREYAGRRWLYYPSTDLILLISNMQDLINEIIKGNLEKNNLKELITTSLYATLDFKFITCNQHRKKLIDYLIVIVNKCLIHNYCKNINKILSGRITDINDDDHFQTKAKKIYSKCFKRKK